MQDGHSRIDENIHVLNINVYNIYVFLVGWWVGFCVWLVFVVVLCFVCLFVLMIYHSVTIENKHKERE